VPAPGAVIALRFVAAAGVEEEYEVGTSFSSSSRVVSDIFFYFLYLMI
jgi:cytochrome bd-type quinol oxidase subunit 1